MSEIIYMESLLEKGQELLGLLFEHGLESSGNYAEEAKEIGEKFQEAGLLQGAVLWQEFGEELFRSRLQTKWDSKKLCGIYGELWQYMKACRHRLVYESVLKSFGD